MSKAEINRYLKDLSKAKIDPNKLKECAELCNLIGDLHSKKRQYSDAIYYHKEALEYSEKDGDRMGMAHANRWLGECYSEESQFDLAEKHIKEYCKIVQNLQDFIEMQRARTTLARLYLTQAQELENEPQEADQLKRALGNAEKGFTKASDMADFLWKTPKLKKELSEKEYAEMKARLLLNIALVKDMKGEFREATQNLLRSIDICKDNKLKEDLYLSQFNLACMYRQHRHKDCMKLIEESIATAKQLRTNESKIYICEAYIQKGLLLLEKNSFQKDEAMKCFYLAYDEQYKDETRCDEVLQKSIKFLKLSYIIYTNFNRIPRVSTESDLMAIHDKLGDCFSELKMFEKAIVHYEEALKNAKSCNRPNTEIAAFYTSLAECYADNEQYGKAIEYYEKELRCWRGSIAEESRTLVKIAQMKEYMNSSPDIVIDAYKDAHRIARDDEASEYNVLKIFVPYLSSNDPSNPLLPRYQKILETRPAADDNHERDEPSIVDDICLDDIISLFTNDDDDEEGFKYLNVPGKTKRTHGSRRLKKLKINDYGETPLHQACINGDKKAVERLLDNDHPLNPVENSGWTPLHEAANNGHTEIVDLLLKRGAKVNFRGHKGITPLHDAASNGHFEIIELLLKNNANCIALDDEGNTPLDYLMKFSREGKNTMTNSQIAECEQTKFILKNAMNQAGFDFKTLMINRMIESSTRKRPNADIIAKNTNRHKDLVDDLPPNPVKEYKSAITDLRRTTTTKKHTVPTKSSESNAPLGAPTLKADMKDWMIDDVSKNKRERNKYCRDGLDDEYEEEDLKEVVEDNESGRESDDIELLYNANRDKRVEVLILDDEDISKDKRVHKKCHRNLLDDDDDEEIQEVNEDSMSHVEMNNFESLNDLGHNDGIEIDFPDDDDVSIGGNQPNLLSLVERYIQACQDDNVEPSPRTGQLYTKLEIAQESRRIDLSFCRIPREHVLPLVRSWKRNDIDELSLNASNICLDDERDVLLSCILPTLHRLTILSLSLCGLNDKSFAILCKTELPKLTKVNLSFNDISCQTDDFLKNLDKLSQNVSNIQELDIRWNNYDKSFNSNNLNDAYKFKILLEPINCDKYIYKS